MAAVVIAGHQGGRRYLQVACAASSVVVALSVGVSSAPPATAFSRLHPPFGYTPNGSWRSNRNRYSTSVGQAAGGGSTTAGVSRALVVNNPVAEVLKLSTNRNKVILMTDSADHITGKTGLAASLVIQLSKDGGSLATVTPAITDLGVGLYNLALTTTHTNTLGDFALSATASGADPTTLIATVEAERSGLLGASGIQSIWDALTSALTTVGSIGKLLVTNLDVVLSSRAPEAGGNVVAIKTVTDQLTAAQAEPAVVPAANASPLSKIAWVFMLARNRMTVTSAQQKVRDDTNAFDVGTSNVSDNGTTFDRGKFT